MHTINTEFQKDLDWWLNFSEHFNGTVSIIGTSDLDTVDLISDASQNGFGAYCAGNWIAGYFNSLLVLFDLVCIDDIQDHCGRTLTCLQPISITWNYILLF